MPVSQIMCVGVCEHATHVCVHVTCVIPGLIHIMGSISCTANEHRESTNDNRNLTCLIITSALRTSYHPLSSSLLTPPPPPPVTGSADYTIYLDISIVLVV